MQDLMSPDQKSELYPECTREGRKEVEKGVLLVGQKGTKKQKKHLQV